MASGGTEVSLALFLVTMFCAGAMAQSGCTNVLIGMSPCLNYVTGSSTTPSSSCCSSLASVVQLQPQCVCSALNGGGAALGININETLALALPAACRVQTPPVSQCDAGSNTPAPSPVGFPQSTQADSPTSSLSGSITVPENGASSGSTNTEGSHQLIATCILFVVSLASIFSSI